MPVWLRNFTFKKIDQFYEKENERQEEQSGATSIEPPKTIRPPDYVMKAHK